MRFPTLLVAAGALLAGSLSGLASAAAVTSTSTVVSTVTRTSTLTTTSTTTRRVTSRTTLTSTLTADVTSTSTIVASVTSTSTKVFVVSATSTSVKELDVTSTSTSIKEVDVTETSTASATITGTSTASATVTATSTVMLTTTLTNMQTVTSTSTDLVQITSTNTQTVTSTSTSRIQTTTTTTIPVTQYTTITITNAVAGPSAAAFTPTAATTVATALSGPTFTNAPTPLSTPLAGSKCNVPVTSFSSPQVDWQLSNTSGIANCYNACYKNPSCQSIIFAPSTSGANADCYLLYYNSSTTAAYTAAPCSASTPYTLSDLGCEYDRSLCKLGSGLGYAAAPPAGALCGQYGSLTGNPTVIATPGYVDASGYAGFPTDCAYNCAQATYTYGLGCNAFQISYGTVQNGMPIGYGCALYTQSLEAVGFASNGSYNPNTGAGALQNLTLWYWDEACFSVPCTPYG